MSQKWWGNQTAAELIESQSNGRVGHNMYGEFSEWVRLISNLPQNGTPAQRDLIGSSLTIATTTTASLIPHYAFCKYGRPCYLVDNDVMDVAKSLDVGIEDLSNLFETCPYPSFAFVFEKNQPLRAIFITNKSGTSGILNELFSSGVFDNETSNIFVKKIADGLRSLSESFLVLDSRSAKSVDGIPSVLSMIATVGRELKLSDIVNSVDEFNIKGAEVTPGDRSLIISAIKLASVLLMLWRSRPEFVQPVGLSRSDRYQFKGDETKLRQWVLPIELITRVKSSVASEGGGWTVRPHWRAGCFRHYRHERYARNPDGSVKVEYIEPCFVGDKEKDPEATIS